MRKHFESGLAFMIVAMLSIGAGLLLVTSGARGNGLGFLSAGGFWLIIAIVARSKSTNKRADSGERNDTG